MVPAQMQTAKAAIDWIAGPVFITDGDARISADGILRNFGTKASLVCAKTAAKWAARDDAHAQNVWHTIQQLVDRSIASADHRQGGNYVHIPRHPYPEFQG